MEEGTDAVIEGDGGEATVCRTNVVHSLDDVGCEVLSKLKIRGTHRTRSIEKKVKEKLDGTSRARKSVASNGMDGRSEEKKKENGEE